MSYNATAVHPPQHPQSAHSPTTTTTSGPSSTTASLNSPDAPHQQSGVNSLPRPPRPPQPVHKRTYQACIPCRQRKVRCDLGSVEAPHDPPCVRCRRESKECFFSATRRKRTPSVEIPPGLGRGRGVRKIDPDGENADLKRLRTDSAFRSPEYGGIPQRSPSFVQHPQPYAGAIDPQLSRPQPLHPPPPPPSAQHSATTTEMLLQTEVYNSHEALLTLIEAAGKDTPMDTSAMKSESRSPSADGEDDSQGQTLPISTSSPQHPSPGRQSGRWNQSVQFSLPGSLSGSGSTSHPGPHLRRKSLMKSPKAVVDPAVDDGTDKALKAWNKFRFVRAGWFSAREAMTFVEYFYSHLHPLSPTLTNPTLTHVSHRRYHHYLLQYEPFLATTILTVASRYMTLPAPGGQSRSFAIHDMLWREVRGAFERLMWGGGWGGLGVPRPVEANLAVDPTNGAETGRGLRTIGTVEGLLILTEWHVRGLHFPMDVEESDWGIDVSDDEGPPSPTPTRGGVVEELGDKIENILEPAYRSDRMSWMLLGNALALAYELGVFDETETPNTPAPTPPATTPPEPPSRVRSKRIQRLLLVYVLQLASRLGWTSMIPRGVRDSVSHKRSPTTSPLPRTTNWSNPDVLQDAVFTTWVDLTILMNTSSELLFPSRSITKQIMRSGQYVALLEHLQPLLRNWKSDFELLCLPSPIHQILILEYEHVRFYVNSLALQAVVDRCSQSARPDNNSNNKAPALWEMNSQDLEFIREVVDAARSLLSTVVHQMFPHGYLKHAPVRIYLRILSAAMFLLKTFALGAKEVEVKESMELIEGVCECLRQAAVDDVHLGLRFADLLGGLVGRVRQRFVRMHRSPHGSPPPQQRQGAEAEQDGAVVGETQNGHAPYVGNYAATPTMMQQQGGMGEVGSEYEIPGGGGAGGGWGWGNEDWLALPLDPILGFEGVTQGTMGVDVGGMDLLEVLLAPSGG